MSKIRVGFIGCGNVATRHALWLLKIPEAQIVALCDIDPGAFERLYQRVPGLVPDLPRFSDYRQMLDTVELDAVQVLTPHTLHFEHITNSLERGLHVLVEKPMVCTSEQARAVIEAKDRAGKAVVVSYQRRYQENFRFIRDLLNDGPMGKVQYVSGLLGQDWLNLFRNTWRHDPGLSGGGQINDSGSHLLDIVMWATGARPQNVYASMEYFDAPVDINTALTARCEDGVLLNLAIVGNGAEWRDEITFWTENGVIYYRDGQVTAKLRNQEAELIPPAGPDPDNPARNFIAACLGDEPVKSPPEDALKVALFTETIWRSAQTGSPQTVAWD
ncbi:MAG: Gfo/Idh/MocA family oxidoreductase [Firmicutes bacterium]|jgi:predicted dehydrogenase|nr:Gfo/Idh/MocA family oxidoreductase [Bacillota bacterium]